MMAPPDDDEDFDGLPRDVSSQHALAHWCARFVCQGVLCPQVALACFFVITVKEYLYTTQGQVYYPRKSGMSEIALVVALVDGLLSWLHESAQLGGLESDELEGFMARTHYNDPVEAVWRAMHT
ncbi:hypothetical protein MN608_10343 [Microdochium nivale]|nr:hypothetical protein MN608_10343 [Microdochium nivale]